MGRDITQCHPRLQAAATKLIAECAKRGIAIKIGECYRTVAEQNELYAQGRTKPGPIVTNAPGSSYSSQHQWGVAFDFYLGMDVDGDGKTTDDAFNDATGLFSKVGEIAVSIGLGWGGNWVSIKDKPHVYLPDWGSGTNILKKQYGNPDAFRRTWAGVNPDPVKPTPGPNLIIKDGQVHVNNFVGAGIPVDGYDGPKTRRAAIMALQSGLIWDYHVGMALSGVWNSAWDSLLRGKVVKQGSKGMMVTATEILLMLKGYNPMGVECPGICADGLTNTIMMYQKEHGLAVDGVAGYNTLKSLIG